MKVRIDIYRDHVGDVAFVYLGQAYLFFAGDAPASNWNDICRGVVEGVYAGGLFDEERHGSGGLLHSMTYEV